MAEKKPEQEELHEETVKEVVEEKTESKKVEKEKVVPYDMTMSEEIGELAAALAKAQGAMHNGKQDAAAHNYKYMELGQVIDIARKPLSENGIAVIQSNELDKNGSPSVITTTLLAHSSGQWVKSRLELPISPSKMLNKAQMVGVSATYGRRYAYQAIIGLAAERDTDGK